MEIRHILAPTDFSTFSKQALEYAAAFARTFGARLSLLHVIETPAFPVEGYVPPNLGTTLLEDLERGARDELDRLLPEAKRSHVNVMREVKMGTPYRTIIETAEEEKVDLTEASHVYECGRRAPDRLNRRHHDSHDAPAPELHRCHLPDRHRIAGVAPPVIS